MLEITIQMLALLFGNTLGWKIWRSDLKFDIKGKDDPISRPILVSFFSYHPPSQGGEFNSRLIDIKETKIGVKISFLCTKSVP